MMRGRPAAAAAAAAPAAGLDYDPVPKGECTKCRKWIGREGTTNEEKEDVYLDYTYYINILEDAYGC